MELNDREFDSTFRKKVFDAEPQFEEASWDKMEQKLQRRDRVQLFRKTCFIGLVFLVVIGGYLLLNNPFSSPIYQNTTNNIVEKQITKPIGETHKKPILTKPSSTKPNITQTQVLLASRKTSFNLVNMAHFQAAKQLPNLTQTTLSAILPDVSQRTITIIPLPPYKKIADDNASKKASKQIRTLPMNLAIHAGPEFNSASTLMGGQSGFSAGITFGIGITKRLNLQTGLRYSIKDYHASSYAYKFSNQRIQNSVSEVEASCDVVEIPLLASYTINDNRKGSLHLNAGISSYLMLREDYVFRYTPQSGINDRAINRSNENQHFLSVADLSATYFIKLRNNNLNLGIEPFIKIPLTGVGEGKINLKSNGISLKLRYDLDKKNN